MFFDIGLLNFELLKQWFLVLAATARVCPFLNKLFIDDGPIFVTSSSDVTKL